MTKTQILTIMWIVGISVGIGIVFELIRPMIIGKTKPKQKKPDS